MSQSKETYNEECVYYCKDCLSLAIRETEEHGISYCSDCSSSNIGTTTIDNWNKLYYERYGKQFIDDKVIDK